ncbi:hypothetical protein CKF54_05525 [Psittacicella hinzii]|uniref:ABC transmembrane type-1 domain-containing protein n=1 Tax=Psittacicella hinzii TaxID=2028575 RepID=A0A3A1Y419_9GAMM|nr:hypothetical protein [Psittacicella hinzii]RIY32049.1 hypothetical protein CKF54_05525 [Psittacicella hinzii]
MKSINHLLGNSQRNVTFHEMICLIIVFVAIFYSLFGSWLISFPADQVVPQDELVAPFESYQHILGTDVYGRDLLDVFLLGIHKNYLVAIVIVLLDLFLIIPLALVFGFYFRKEGIIRSLTAPLTVFVSLFYYFVLIALFGPSLFIAASSVCLYIFIYTFHSIYRDVVQVMDSTMVRHLLLDGATFKQILRLVLLPTLIDKISRQIRRVLLLVVAELILIGVLQQGISPTSVYWGNVMYQAWLYQEQTPYALFIITCLVSIVLYATFVIFKLIEELVKESMQREREKLSQAI